MLIRRSDEPPPQHNTRRRARDHGHVPVLRPGAVFCSDRPIHRHPGGQEMRGEILKKNPYKIQNDIKYLCNRDSETALSHDLSALVGLYVEII